MHLHSSHLPASGWDAKLYVYRGWEDSDAVRAFDEAYVEIGPAETTCSNFLIDTMSGTVSSGNQGSSKATY